MESADQAKVEALSCAKAAKIEGEAAAAEHANQR